MNIISRLLIVLALAAIPASAFGMGSFPTRQPDPFSFENTTGVETGELNDKHASGALNQALTPQMQAILTQQPGALGPDWDAYGNPIHH